MSQPTETRTASCPIELGFYWRLYKQAVQEVNQYWHDMRQAGKDPEKDPGAMARFREQAHWWNLIEGENYYNPALYLPFAELPAFMHPERKRFLDERPHVNHA